MDVVDELLTNREAIFAKFKKKLLKAREVMKQLADTK